MVEEGEWNRVVFLENFLTSLVPYVITVIPIIVYVIKLTIDNWKLTDLEKIRMSNFKKFQIALTKYVLIGIISFVILFFVFLFKNPSNLVININVLMTLVILSIILVFCIIVAEKVIDFFSRILSFKYDYHIVNEDGDSLYRIIKVNSNGDLLVESNDILEFIDSKQNLKYKSFRRDMPYLSKLYRSKWTKGIIKGITILCIVLLISLFITNSWVRYMIYFSFIFFTLILLIIMVNYLDEKKHNN